MPPIQKVKPEDVKDSINGKDKEEVGFKTGEQQAPPSRSVERRLDIQEGIVTAACRVEGCGYIAKGRTEGIARNALRMHSKKHTPKKKPWVGGHKMKSEGEDIDATK